MKTIQIMLSVCICIFYEMQFVVVETISSPFNIYTTPKKSYFMED